MMPLWNFRARGPRTTSLIVSKIGNFTNKCCPLEYIEEVYKRDMQDISDKLYAAAQNRSSMWGYVCVLCTVVILMFLVPLFVLMVRRYLRDRVDKKMGQDIEHGQRAGYSAPRMDVRHSVEMPDRVKGALQGPKDPVEITMV